MASARLYLKPPTRLDCDAFLSAVRRSTRLHGRWVSAPRDAAAFASRFIERSDGRLSFLLTRREDHTLVGAVVINEIVRGVFQSGYLGYYAFSPYERMGYMREGLGLVLDEAFVKIKLHRLEANIQPANEGSIALVRALGFQKEGLSRRYLKIGGRWRDHERWALLAEDWRKGRARPRRQ